MGLSTSSSDANSGIGVSFTSVGSGVHQLYEKTVKMVGAKHLPYPHPLIYDTLAESLPGSTLVGDIVTEVNPETETETATGEGTTQTTQTTETTGGGTTTTETTTTTTTTDSSGSTSSTTTSSSSSSSSSSGSTYYSNSYPTY